MYFNQSVLCRAGLLIRQIYFDSSTMWGKFRTNPLPFHLMDFFSRFPFYKRELCRLKMPNYIRSMNFTFYETFCKLKWKQKINSCFSTLLAEIAIRCTFSSPYALIPNVSYRQDRSRLAVHVSKKHNYVLVHFQLF